MISGNFSEQLKDKFLFYIEKKISVTFRLINHPEYFITGIIKELKEEIIRKADEDRDGYYQEYIILELNNGELCFFYTQEIDYETVIPSKYNPIRYFIRDKISEELRKNVFERDNHICKLNLEGCTNKAEEIDHIIPITKGGLTTIDNLQSSCRNCNRKKGINMIF